MFLAKVLFFYQFPVLFQLINYSIKGTVYKCRTLVGAVQFGQLYIFIETYAHRYGRERQYFGQSRLHYHHIHESDTVHIPVFHIGVYHRPVFVRILQRVAQQCLGKLLVIFILELRQQFLAGTVFLAETFYCLQHKSLRPIY